VAFFWAHFPLIYIPQNVIQVRLNLKQHLDWFINKSPGKSLEAYIHLDALCLYKIADIINY